MARILIVGCGCRGLALATALLAGGHAVRGSTRRPDRLPELAAAGVEPVLGDPDRVGTLMDAIAEVTVVCWLMGTASGSADDVAALHGSRLRMLVEKLVETPVRALVYEAAGPLDPAVYACGRRVTAEAAATWPLAVEVIESDSSAAADWLIEARATLGRVLTPGLPAR